MTKTRFTIVALLVFLILLGFAVLTGLLLPKLLAFAFSSRPVVLNTSTVLRQVQTLSQLVTVKYVLEKVVVLEDVKWYGESRVLFIAHGNVKAGVDLARLSPDDVRLDGKKISLTLPPAIITDAYLDDEKSQVIERTTGALRQFDKNLEQNARRVAVEDIKRAARTNGILKDAEERARLQLEGLFHQLGFEQVEIKMP